MTRKEKLVKQLTGLTRREMRLKEENLNIVITSAFFEECEAIHQKRMAIWREITQINQREIEERGHL